MVEGISELSEGVLLGERYQLVRRLDLFSAGTERVAGVEYEYWLAVDVTSETEVWVQFAAADGVYAGGAQLAGAVTALRRINHPAVPVVHAFGEYEFELDGEVTSVGYCAIPAVAGETLAAALLREELDQAEILAALAQVAEVFELLAELELVHGHLSAHSVLLTAIEGAGYEVVLADLAASLALETMVESELSIAADVYALAWLIVLALVGPAMLEAEFGAGFAVTAELELLAEEVVLRRREWAAENLVVLGVSETLTEVLLLALGEAGGRPRAAALTAALRSEWMLLATGVEVAAVEEIAAEEIVAAEVAAEEIVAEEIAAEEIVAAEVLGEELLAEEVVETSEKKRKKSGAAKAAVVAGVAGAAVAAEVLEAGAARAAQGAAGAGSASASGAVGVGESTEVIPKVARGPRPKAGAGAGAGSAGAGAAAAFSVGASGGSSSGNSGSSTHHGPRKPKPGLLIGGGVGLVVIVALVIAITSGSSNKSNTASSGSIATPTATAGKSAGATSGASAGSSASASASSGSTAGSSTSTAVASATETFPSTLTTVPSSASQAVQQIQSVVNRAQGELTSTEQAQLNQIISTLTQEISSGQSLSTGMTQFWALLHSNELPSSLNTYLTAYAEYLSASQGS